MITIDGFEWDVPCDAERTASMTASDISGLMLDKRYFADVIGTYMTYDVTLAVPPNDIRRYTELYEILTEPVGYHTFDMPYGEGRLVITARVEEVHDSWVMMPNDKNAWRSIDFSIIANHPTKEMGLEESITRGFPPLPDVTDVPVGAVYEATPTGWVTVDYVDADSKRY